MKPTTFGDLLQKLAVGLVNTRRNLAQELRDASKAIGRVPSLLWLVLYVFLVFAFAAIYCLALPRAFRFRNIEDDALHVAEMDALTRELQYSLRWEISEADFWVPKELGNKTVYCQHAAIDLTTARLVGDQLCFVATVPVSHGDQSDSRNWMTYSYRLKVAVQPEVEEGERLYHRVSVAERDSSDIPYTILFHGHPTGYPNYTSWLILDPWTSKRLKWFADSTTGRVASSAPEDWPRMVYFSAVTITTLGYGDIVPATTWARNAVALESVLGILTIGLFLNSLAREVTED